VKALFGHLRLLPVVLDPGKPESEGQGESSHRLFETSFLPQRTFASIEDLQIQFDTRTTDVAFARHHRRVASRVKDSLTSNAASYRRFPPSCPPPTLT